MTPEDREAAIGRLQGYLSDSSEHRSWNAEGLGRLDQQTPDVMKALADLKADPAWIEELAKVSPLKFKKGRGRKVKADSLDRFVLWLDLIAHAKYSKQAVSQFVLTRQLALEYFVHQVDKITERALRPLRSAVFGKKPTVAENDLPRLTRKAEELSRDEAITAAEIKAAIKELVEERRKAMGSRDSSGHRASEAELKKQRMDQDAADLRQTPEGRLQLNAFIAKQIRLLEAAEQGMEVA